MPARLLEAALGLEGEDLDLLAPHVLDHLGGHGAVQLGAVGDDLVAAGHEDGRRERLARLMRLPVDQERLPLLDLVLLAADLDDRVHEPRNGTKGPVCAWLTAEHPPEEAAALLAVAVRGRRRRRGRSLRDGRLDGSRGRRGLLRRGPGWSGPGAPPPPRPR